MNREQTEGTAQPLSLEQFLNSLPYNATDLKAFEQRLIECISYTAAGTKKWKGMVCDYFALF